MLFWYLQITRKQGKAKRATRPTCANSTVHFLLTYLHTWFAALHRRRTPAFDRRTFSVPRTTCSWWM